MGGTDADQRHRGRMTPGRQHTRRAGPTARLYYPRGSTPPYVRVRAAGAATKLSQPSLSLIGEFVICALKLP